MIGLEVHCQLTRLRSKLFCPCRADYRGMQPNTNVCHVCKGLPGTLPLLNREAVRSALAISMSLNCEIGERLAFFRKNYFYPDLPKNFQITQHDAYGPTSVGGRGRMDIDGKTVRITRVQLEEDPGRLAYEGGDRLISLVDNNRAGVPLVEIVTEPDFDSPRHARNFVGALADILESLGAADPHLDGAMRADGNVSVRGGAKVEIKNVNSFRDLEKALRFETTRQNSLCDRGIRVVQETRHWDERRRITVPSRAKEAEPDYRYLLEADIPWVRLEPETVEEIRRGMPESAPARRARYVAQYGMQPQVAAILASDRFCGDLFERSHTPRTAKLVANLITTDFMGVMDTREKRAASKITHEHVRMIADALHGGLMTRAMAKDLLHRSAREELSVSDLATLIARMEKNQPHKLAREGDDTTPADLGGKGPCVEARATARLAMRAEARFTPSYDLDAVVRKVLQDHPEAALKARENPAVINYLVGMVMKETRGQADPQEAVRRIRESADAPTA